MAFFQKVDPHVKVSLKSAKSGVFGMLYTGRNGKPWPGITNVTANPLLAIQGQFYDPKWEVHVPEHLLLNISLIIAIRSLE